MEASEGSNFTAHLTEVDRYLQAGRVPYAIDRSLEGENSYVLSLPSFRKRDADGKALTESESFIQVIDNLIRQRKVEAQEGDVEYRPPVVMDVGPGNFQALIDARKKWGTDIKLVGLGTDKLLDFGGIVGHGDKSIEPTRQAVLDAGITIIPEDLVKMRDVVPAELRPDVILSSHALQYTGTPLWETFSSQLYDTLIPGGYAFIAFGPPHISESISVFAETGDHYAHFDVLKAINTRYKEDLGRLGKYLESKGYYFDIDPEQGRLSCKKIEVNSSYELPNTIHTITNPTIEDLGLQNIKNLRVPYWVENIPKTNRMYLSAYPAMDIPQEST